MKTCKEYAREYAAQKALSIPHAIGRRCGPQDDEDDLTAILKEGWDYHCWPQGAPDDRKGMVAVFHPATDGDLVGAFAKGIAKLFSRNVHVIKQRDARWVYVFIHDPSVGCDDEACEGSDSDCKKCSEWFDSDYHAYVNPKGNWKMVSAS